MNKVILFFVFLFVCFSAISQPISYRASDVITVSDGRLQAQYNLFIPRYTDTTAANLKKGIDSCGAIIYTYEGNKIWKRSCNPKKWEELSSSGGSGTVTSVSQGFGISNTPNPITTTGTVKVDTTVSGLSGKYLRITDTTNKWVQSVIKINDSTIRVYKNGTGTNIVLPGVPINISQGYGIIASPNPITSTGTITVDTSALSSIYAKPVTYTPTIVPYANSAGALTGAISDMRYISGIFYVGNTNPIGTENAIDLNNGRATIYGNYNGMRINVGSGTTGTVDAVKGITFYNRGTRYGYFGSNGSGGVGNHWFKLDSADLYLPRMAGASDSIAVIEAVTGKVKPKLISYGTVTSVATGYGLSGGTITSSGTLIADTSVSGLSGKYVRISDTANRWLSSVSQPNDSSLTFVKGSTTTTYTIRSSVAGSATRLITTVYNNSGSTITKGSVVYINGAHSSILPSIALAKANAESTSAYTYGLVETDIANNSSGIVIQSGTITNLNLPTSSYTDGQTLYLSPTVAGGYTTTKPLAPNHYVAIGTITRAHPNFGTIQIAIRNGFQLDEMSDVQIPLVPADSTLLQFSRVDSLWHAVAVTNAIGANYIKPSDTASMLTNYARTSAVNLKVNISDTASMLSNYLRNVPTIAYLGSDFNTTNTTATNTNLSIAVAANTAYRIMINGSASKATSSTGMRISISAPTGTTIKANAALGSNAISTITNSFITSVNSLGATFATGVGIEVPFRIEGIIVTGGTAGNIVLQGATVTSNTATIYANTLMTLTKAYSQ
jgi:hypothetical protein